MRRRDRAIDWRETQLMYRIISKDFRLDRNAAFLMSQLALGWFVLDQTVVIQASLQVQIYTHPEGTLIQHHGRTDGQRDRHLSQWFKCPRLNGSLMTRSSKGERQVNEGFLSDRFLNALLRIVMSVLEDRHKCAYGWTSEVNGICVENVSR